MSSFPAVESGVEVVKEEEPVIIIDNLTFNYPNKEPVLRNLNMTLAKGARCLLIGMNGSGVS